MYDLRASYSSNSTKAIAVLMHRMASGIFSRGKYSGNPIEELNNVLLEAVRGINL